MLTITHTHEAGTLIEGTSRGDGSAEILKGRGWRWGRSIGCWYVPSSRDRQPKGYVIDGTVTALAAAGFEVTTDIDTTARSTAEVEAAKAERQEQRVDRLAAKAQRRQAQADAAYARHEHDVDALPPGGEPVKIGHHSENRHRRDIERAHRSMGRAVMAQRDADATAQAAQSATHTTDARYAPVTVANRIDKLGAQIRKADRELTGYTAHPGGPYSYEVKAATGDRRTALTKHRAELVDQLTYWQGIRDEQIASGRAAGYTRATVNPGDLVRIGGTWRRVVRANAKTVSVETGYSWTDRVPYAHISDHEPATSKAEASRGHAG